MDNGAESEKAIDEFLEQQAAAGEEMGEGTFTLALDKAIEKLSAFQLPYPGAWAVKMVQCAVASGAPGLQLLSTDKQSLIRFTPSSGWSAAEVRDALLQPSLPSDRALAHLVIAIRAVAFGEHRELELYLPHQQEGLIWSEGRLDFCRREKALDHLRLLVAHRSQRDESGRSLAAAIKASWSNADVITALAESCFAAPIAVDADGRRVDALWESPEHGRAPHREVLALGFPPADLPPLRLSQRTFEKAPGWSQAEPARPLPSEATLPVLVSAYAGKSRNDVKEGDSHCFWVLDGAVVEREAWPFGSGAVTLGCYLSADGLATDLTTLALVKSPEYERRKIEASRAAGDYLREASSLQNIRETVQHARRDNKLTAKVVLGLGFLTLPVFPLSVPLLVGGGVMLSSADDALEDTVKTLEHGLASLRQNWQAAES